MAPAAIISGIALAIWPLILVGMGQLGVAARAAWPRVRVYRNHIKVRNVATHRLERPHVRGLAIVVEVDGSEPVHCWALEAGSTLDWLSRTPAELERVIESFRSSSELPYVARRSRRPTW